MWLFSCLPYFPERCTPRCLSTLQAEIRVQLRPTPHYVFGGNPDAMRNEVGRWAGLAWAGSERQDVAGLQALRAARMQRHAEHPT